MRRVLCTQAACSLFRHASAVPVAYLAEKTILDDKKKTKKNTRSTYTYFQIIFLLDDLLIFTCRVPSQNIDYKISPLLFPVVQFKLATHFLHEIKYSLQYSLVIVRSFRVNVGRSEFTTGTCLHDCTVVCVLGGPLSMPCNNNTFICNISLCSWLMLILQRILCKNICFWGPFIVKLNKKDLQ